MPTISLVNRHHHTLLEGMHTQGSTCRRCAHDDCLDCLDVMIRRRSDQFWSPAGLIWALYGLSCLAWRLVWSSRILSLGHWWWGYCVYGFLNLQLIRLSHIPQTTHSYRAQKVYSNGYPLHVVFKGLVYRTGKKLKTEPNRHPVRSIFRLRLLTFELTPVAGCLVLKIFKNRYKTGCNRLQPVFVQ
jgi:hypothetical protein